MTNALLVESDYFAIRDKDSGNWSIVAHIFSVLFYTVFDSEGINIIDIPSNQIQLFCRTMGRNSEIERLDNLLTVDESHLRRVLFE